VIQILPFDTIFSKRFVCNIFGHVDCRSFLGTSGFSWLSTFWFIGRFVSLGSDLSKRKGLFVKFLDSIGCKHTFGVHMENMWSIKLTINHSISCNFLHHFLLRRVTITLTYKSSFFDFGMGCALGIVWTFVSLGLSSVWSAFFSNHVSVFSKETVEEWPATITAFIHVVACHHELGWKLWHIFTVFES